MCMMESCFFRKNYKKIPWEKKKAGGRSEKFQLEGRICNKNAALFGFLHIPHGLISVS